MRTYKFIKTGAEWFIDLPEYIEQGGHKGDLQMVEGADTMLDIMSNNGTEVVLAIDKIYFDGADTLELIEICDPSIGGGNYQMAAYEGRTINLKMWLCKVTEFVLGEIPQKIFVRREK